MGIGIESIFEAIIKRIPSPNVDRNAPLRALLYDSWYDRYRGTLALVYIKDGGINVGDEITYAYTKKTYEVKTLSILKPNEEQVQKLYLRKN